MTTTPHYEEYTQILKERGLPCLRPGCGCTEEAKR